MEPDFEPTPIIGGYYYSEELGDSVKVTFLKEDSVGIQFEDGTREILDTEEWNEYYFEDGDPWNAEDSDSDDDEDDED